MPNVVVADRRHSAGGDGIPARRDTFRVAAHYLQYSRAPAPVQQQRTVETRLQGLSWLPLAVQGPSPSRLDSFLREPQMSRGYMLVHSSLPTLQ